MYPSNIRRRWQLPCVLVLLYLSSVVCECNADSTSSLRHVQIQVRHIDYEFAVKTGNDRVPRFDWNEFRSRPRAIVTTTWPAIELENNELKVQIVPSKGRIHSLVNKHTGHEQLWINPTAVPLGANNDTGFWMTWGGIERVLPSREHGTSHALTWDHRILIDTDQRKMIRLAVVEPLKRLRHFQYISLFADKPYLETTIVIENMSAVPTRFSHWTTSVLAPGGTGEVTPNTELVLPADEFVPDDRDFNEWMLPLAKDTRISPLRFVKNWTSIGDLMTSRLLQPYYAVYSHEQDEGLVHTFDLEDSPTVDIWGWGYPATVKRQQAFTAAGPNNGYIEFWNGNAKNFKDESLQTIGAGETISWTERTFCVQGLLGDDRQLRRFIGAEVSRHHPIAAPVEIDRRSRTNDGSAYQIELSTLATGDAKFSWFQTRGTAIPGAIPKLLVTGQQKTNDGSHGYHDVYSFESIDAGHSWSKPKLIPSLRRRRNPDGYDVVAGDLWLTYHPQTRRVLATGKTFNFRDGKHEEYTHEKVSYAVYDPTSNKWSNMRTVDMPTRDHSGATIIAPNAGCNQPVLLSNGNLLIPIRYQRQADWRNYVTIVAECVFDGDGLRYIRHGSELTHPIGRGLYEPSLTEFNGEYFLALRADEDAFVARSSDGTQFSDPVAWRFDDGKSLGSYNTQQHWISRPDALYLIYTRIATGNAHILRRRAPLFIARVCPKSMRVIRSTERVLIPDNGWTLGNFGVFSLGEHETIVITSEGIPAKRNSWADNRVIQARIIW